MCFWPGLRTNFPTKAVSQFLFRDGGRRGSPFETESGLGEQSATSEGQRIITPRLQIGLVHTDRTRRDRKKPFDEIARQVLHDEDQAGAVIVVRPALKAHGRMEDMLDAMDDDRARRIVGERDDALDAQQVRPLRGAEHGEEGVEPGR